MKNKSVIERTSLESIEESFKTIINLLYLNYLQFVTKIF